MASLDSNTAANVSLSPAEQTFTVALDAGKQYRIDLHGTGNTAADASYAATLKVFGPGPHTQPSAPATELVIGRLDANTAEKGTLYFTPPVSGNYDFVASATAAGTYTLGAAANALQQNYLLAPQDGTATRFTGSPGNDLIALGSFYGYSSASSLSPFVPPTVSVEGGSGFDTVVVTHRGVEVTDNAHLSREADGLYLRASYNGLSAYGLSQAPAVTQLNVKLTGVEAVQFYNTTVFTLDAAHANVARLYEGALGRAPDIAGLAYQLGRLDMGDTLQQIAHGFLASPEFAGSPAAASVETFVARLYQNALGRAPETAGLNFYAGAMARGDMTPEAVLIGIADSPESQQHNGQVVFQ